MTKIALGIWVQKTQDIVKNMDTTKITILLPLVEFIHFGISLAYW